MDGVPGAPSIYRDYGAAIPSSTATVIRSSCSPLLEPAPEYFLRLMPFSENSLVTGHDGCSSPPNPKAYV